MNSDEIKINEEQGLSNDKEQRLDRLSRKDRVSYRPGYSKLVRWMRLILPVIALLMIGVLFAWPSMKDNVVQVVDTESEMKLTGRKELLNPVFESVDKKDQPYKIIAKRAVQGETQENLVLLEQPSAHILMQNNEDLDVTANSGAYRQDEQRLFLEGNVKLVYNNDHTLETAKLDVDMKQSQAWSKTDVKAYGSMGVLTAKGLEARNDEGLLIFTGPAKLVLQESLPGF